MQGHTTRIQSIVKNLNIELNSMQQQCLNDFDKHQNIQLLSPTGTGKTIGFLLPLVASINPAVEKVQAIVIAPSRELALQIEQVVKSMRTGFKVVACYGGHAMRVEKQSLVEPPLILIGTPGRIADHLYREHFETSKVKTLVLDEFDKSLEFGFTNEMSFILRKIPSIEKKVLTSATQMADLPAFTKIDTLHTIDYTHEKESIQLTLKKVVSPEKDKLYTLLDLLHYTQNESTLVFTNHREASERIGSFLEQNDVVYAVFHGGMEQKDREQVLAQFRNGSTKLLVTTDLAARGLDIPEIKYIIHYHLPATEAAFTHRNGRTARMHKNGTAFILVSQTENLPEYVDQTLEVFGLPKNNTPIAPPQWVTIMISGGKKDKLNKVDIVGFLLKQAELKKDDVGLIEVKDFFSYVAVKRTLIPVLNQKLKDQKIKAKKLKYSFLF